MLRHVSFTFGKCQARSTWDYHDLLYRSWRQLWLRCDVWDAVKCAEDWPFQMCPRCSDWKHADLLLSHHDKLSSLQNDLSSVQLTLFCLATLFPSKAARGNYALDASLPDESLWAVATVCRLCRPGFLTAWGPPQSTEVRSADLISICLKGTLVRLKPYKTFDKGNGRCYPRYTGVERSFMSRIKLMECTWLIPLSTARMLMQ